VAITYRSGLADAGRVASSIRRAGRNCEILHYDVLDTADNQLAPLEQQPTHVYYFATGPISLARKKPFDQRRFDECCSFYVRGFSHLCTQLPTGVQHPVRLFYPSSSYISAADRPKGLAEYAMAKAAGEVLCEEINATLRHLRITSRRLPRMLTDQTSGVGPVAGFAPASTVLLEALRELHSR
jgi:hypothetical protein